MPAPAPEDQWVAIQHKTFVNWANEQLSLGNRSVTSLASDFTSGVNLVALVEALQFKKIGKVYASPKSQIQAMQNVSLALQAVGEDNVRLVNIGTDDIVGGNFKLTLGLLWHLILRYQISSSKSKAPPKKLMLMWFQAVLKGVKVTNFTTSWSDGIALHALLEYLKPGLSPNWNTLSAKDRVENCRSAMQLAKDAMGVPRVVSPEDFASHELDELSAMTYLSYFLRKSSPGYYSTLNWACKQLRTTNINNLTTDWNNGYYLCCLVNSLGGEVPGWPEMDADDHVATCQKGLDSARASLGIAAVLTAGEMSDPHVDHLAIMAYLSKFEGLKPKKPKAERIKPVVACSTFTQGDTVEFILETTESNIDKTKVEVKVSHLEGTGPVCTVTWEGEARAVCSFVPVSLGEYKVHVCFDLEPVQGCPLTFHVTPDLSTVQLKGQPSLVTIGGTYEIEVACPSALQSKLTITAQGPSGQDIPIALQGDDNSLMTDFVPSSVGPWSISLCIDGQQLSSQSLSVYDVSQARIVEQLGSCMVGSNISLKVDTSRCGCTLSLEADIEYSSGRTLHDVTVTQEDGSGYILFSPKATGPHRIRVSLNGEPVTGSPVTLDISDPSQAKVIGEGCRSGVKGSEASFTVDRNGLVGELDVVVSLSGQSIAVQREEKSKAYSQFTYIPHMAGIYDVSITWQGVHVAGSPFQAEVIDKTSVTLLNDLSDLRDDQGHIFLEFDQPFGLSFDVSLAGPGTFTGEVLGPQGKLLVTITQADGRVDMSCTPHYEGDHYLHLYWSGHPVEWSPLLGYCPGPARPLDARMVEVIGEGAETARATVMASFEIDGSKAGPGVPRVKLQGVQSELPVTVTALMYHRYRCDYLSNVPGSFLLYISWSDIFIPGCPFKINIQSKGDARRVKVTGGGLHGGIVGHELKVFVDTTATGPGQISASCQGQSLSAQCDIKENSEGHYTLRVLPCQAERHFLTVTYDDVHVPGSPFVLRVGEPPDPSEVKVFGPGIEDGLCDWFESRFLVETQGAGAGQLAVKVKGPRGGFKVDMRRENKSERTITCRYDPTEPGEYVINVRWSGVHVPGSPFSVMLVDTQEELQGVLRAKGKSLEVEDDQWRDEF